MIQRAQSPQLCVAVETSFVFVFLLRVQDDFTALRSQWTQPCSVKFPHTEHGRGRVFQHQNEPKHAVKNKNVDKEDMEQPGLSPDVTPAVEKQFVFMFAVLSCCAIFDILKNKNYVFRNICGCFHVCLVGFCTA